MASCSYQFSIPSPSIFLFSFGFSPHRPQWCEAWPECHRLKLKDFLAMPMQRLMKYPLLFTAISKETTDHTEKQQLEHIVSVDACSLISRHFLHMDGNNSLVNGLFKCHRVSPSFFLRTMQ